MLLAGAARALLWLNELSAAADDVWADWVRLEAACDKAGVRLAGFCSDGDSRLRKNSLLLGLQHSLLAHTTSPTVVHHLVQLQLRKVSPCCSACHRHARAHTHTLTHTWQGSGKTAAP